MTPHSLHKLTQRFIDNVYKDGLYADGGGLYLQVQRGSKSWSFRYLSPTSRKRRLMGLGAAHTVSKEMAREQARDFRLQVQDGKDPIGEQERAKIQQQLARAKKLTFGQVAQQWLDAKDPQWERPTAVNIKRQLEIYVYPRLGHLPIQLLDMSRPDNSATNLIFNTLKPIWQPKAATAKNLLWVLEGILDYARASNLVAGDNAADINGPLGHVLPRMESFYVPKRHAALPHKEIAGFMAELRSYRSPNLVSPVRKNFRCAIC